MDEIPNAQQALARIQTATSMAELCDGFQDLVAALEAYAAWTRLALIGANHDWLVDDVARTEQATFIANQEQLISVLDMAHHIVRQKAARWSATAAEVGATLQ